jgi:hypothetical protein
LLEAGANAFTKFKAVKLFGGEKARKLAYECKKANYKLPKKALYESICKCVYESGYHTDPKYKFRAEFMTEYWEIKTKNFPIEEF